MRICLSWTEELHNRQVVNTDVNGNPEPGAIARAVEQAFHNSGMAFRLGLVPESIRVTIEED